MWGDNDMQIKVAKDASGPCTAHKHLPCWTLQKPIEKADRGFEQGTQVVMGAKPWTPLSTMPPPGETWSIGMHKHCFTHHWFTKTRKTTGVMGEPDLGHHSLLCILQVKPLDHAQLTSTYHAGLCYYYEKCGLDKSQVL